MSKTKLIRFNVKNVKYATKTGGTYGSPKDYKAALWEGMI